MIVRSPLVSDQHGPPGAAQSLRRTLGVWRVSLTGIGVILGAGVYALIGPAAAQAGNAMWLAGSLPDGPASVDRHGAVGAHHQRIDLELRELGLVGNQQGEPADGVRHRGAVHRRLAADCAEQRGQA